MSDLRSLMQARAGELAGTLAKESDFDDGVVVTGVRRKRRRNTAVASLASFAGVAVLGFSGVFMMNYFAEEPPAMLPEPAPVPSVVASPTPTVAPSPSPTPEPELADPGFAGTVTVSEQLPSAEAITPEVWARAGSGWVIAIYRESGYDGLAERYTSGPHVLYLVSPEGERYELTALDQDSSFHILWWEAGSTTATVARRAHDTPQVWLGFSSSDVGNLDLTTGEYLARTQSVDFGDAETYGPWIDLDGTPIYSVTSGGTRGVKGGPDGLVVAYEAPVDEATLTEILQDLNSPAQGRRCGVAGPASATEMLIRCTEFLDDAGRACALNSFDCVSLRMTAHVALTDGTTRLVYEDTPGTAAFSPSAVVAGQLVGTVGATHSDAACSHGLATATSTGLRTLVGTDDTTHALANAFEMFGASGANVYVKLYGECSELTPVVLARINLNTGDVTELVPFPPGEYPWVSESVVAWYVAP